MKARRATRTSSPLTSILLATGTLAALGLTPACGGAGDEGDGDGGSTSTGGVAGDGDTGTGGLGTGGSGTGGLGSGGDGTGGTGGSGTGGGGTGGSGTGGGGTGGSGTGGDGTGGGDPGAAYNCNPAEGTVPLLGLEEVESGFDEPVLVTHAGDDRLFVVERAGVIRVIENGSTLPAPFLDIEDEVDSSGPFGEMGLLGLAFHPDHATNGLLYVYYIQDNDNQWGSSRIVEYSVMADDPNQVDTSTERELILLTQPDQNHNGGQLAFGPDGMLYFGFGDGGGSGDPDGNGQDVTTLLGSLIRIDPTGRDDGAYTVPSGNLSEVMGSALPEIFSYGLRNPYRFNFDLCTGDLYIGDVGQNAYEEVNVTPSGVGQLNYGWDTMEGTHCYSPMNGCDETGITQPLYDYPRGGGAAVIGGVVYRGSEIPGLRGKYVFADSQQSGGRVWYSEYDPSGPSLAEPTEITQELGSPGAIVSIQNGPDGEIYMTRYIAGTVVKLVAAQ